MLNRINAWTLLISWIARLSSSVRTSSRNWRCKRSTNAIRFKYDSFMPACYWEDSLTTENAISVNFHLNSDDNTTIPRNKNSGLAPARRSGKGELLRRLFERGEVPLDPGRIDLIQPCRLPGRLVVLVDKNGPPPFGKIGTGDGAPRKRIFDAKNR